MTDSISLVPHHLKTLRDESGVAEAIIAACGYRTVTQETELVKLGFAAAQRRVPGLLLPQHTTHGRAGGFIYRPDNPRVVENQRKRLPDGSHSIRVVMIFTDLVGFEVQ